MTDLKDSIKRHGVLVPIFVDTDGTVIDGHHRQQYALELGLEYPALTWPEDVLPDVRREISRVFRRMAELIE